jgi:hypothetical protein
MAGDFFLTSADKGEIEMACIQMIVELTIRDSNYPQGDERNTRIIRNGTCFANSPEWRWLIDAGFAVWYYV